MQLTRIFGLRLAAGAMLAVTLLSACYKKRCPEISDHTDEWFLGDYTSRSIRVTVLEGRRYRMEVREGGQVVQSNGVYEWTMQTCNAVLFSNYILSSHEVPRLGFRGFTVHQRGCKILLISDEDSMENGFHLVNDSQCRGE